MQATKHPAPIRRLLSKALLLALALCPIHAGEAKPSAKPSAAQLRPTLAVLYFDYEGRNEELQVLRKGIAELMITNLSELPGVRVVERLRLEAVLAEHKLQRKIKLDRNSAVRLGKLLGAKYLVWGSYFNALGSLCLTAKVVETETGQTLPSAHACGAPPRFWELYSKVVAAIRQTVSTKLSAFGAPERRTPRAKAKANANANAKPKPRTTKSAPLRLTTRVALAFARALDASDQGKKELARRQLRTLVKEQPNFVQARLLLAQLGG